ncbi:MAG: 50S ribosomal protein L9, partial [Acidobacteria bacterium]|nr:50S ribosomal protein L9 [Acidobacteriota bacterium]
MKVILRSDRKGLGKRGDIVEVSEGHARNFLLPKGHAIVATDGAVSQATAMRRARDLRDAQDRESAQAIATKLVA